MLVKTVLLLGLVVTAANSVRFCLNHVSRVCYPCDRTNVTSAYCHQITNDMKIIYFQKETLIRYESYINSNIKIIKEPTKVTYYQSSCMYNSQNYYYQVQANTFYPIENELNFSPLPVGKLSVATNKYSRFQTCLEIYCRFRVNNHLTCSDDHIDGFDFVLNENVTLTCIQNITSINIRSRSISEMYLNTFFRNVYNTVHMDLMLDNLQHLDCATFHTLQNLREIEIQSRNTVQVNSDQCLFRYNPNLVLVVINRNWYWSTCRRDFYKHFSNVSDQPTSYLVFSILLLMFLVWVSFTAYYLFSIHEPQQLRQ